MKRILPGCLLLLGLAACATLPPVPPPEDLIFALKHRSPPSSLGGTGVLSLKGPQGRGAVRFAFLTAPPDFLRIDAIGPFGNLVFLLVHTSESLEIYLPGEGRYLSGRSARDTIGSYFPPEISLRELIAFLSGHLPGPVWETEPITVTPSRKKLLLAFGNDPGKMEACYSRRDLTLRSFESPSAPGRSPYRAAFDRYGNRGGIRLPGRIRISVPNPEGELRVRIDVSEARVNPDLEGNPFRIFPGGY